MMKVSIIMPVYNSEDNLKNSIDSIKSQTFEDFELICINDGSTDRTPEILEAYSKSDSRIKVLSQKNSGPGCARNRGLENCTGQYVYFMDSDDFIVPEFLETLLDNMARNDSDFAMFKVGTITDDENMKTPTIFDVARMIPDADFDNLTFDYTSIPEFVLNESFAPWTKFYNREFLQSSDEFKFDEKLPYEDILFHVKSMLRASKISYVPKYLYYYRSDNDNSLSFNRKLDFKIFDVVDMVGKYLTDEGFMKEFEKEFEFFKLAQITSHISTPVDEGYFHRAKSYLNGIDYEKNDAIYEILKERYAIFFNSKTPEDYQDNMKIQFLSEKNQKIKRRHKKLKKERDLQKIKNEELTSSTSWRITMPLRKFTSNYANRKNRFNEYFLSKSNSYNYYKHESERLSKKNKKLNKKLGQYEKAYPPKECPICGYKGIDFMPYPQIIHREVECPNCHSHERHRALWLYFKNNPQLLANKSRLLHFAPEPQFRELFEKSDMEYYPVDVSDEKWVIDEVVDVQDIPYEDNYFDLILCSHVLEHVPDDRKAISELYRVLKPGGTALILVPINGIAFELPYDETKTLEDERFNTPELREKHYGQFDHVRLYGSDFRERLVECGFEIKSDDFIKKLGYETVERYALIRNENIFECTK